MLRELTTPHRLLVALAHPDDESFGPAGTLARYASKDVAVHYICATRGEAGEVDPGFLRNHQSVADLRTAELRCAARHLGLTGLHLLDYRDSGMDGTPENQHPASLVQAPLDTVVQQIVRLMPLFGQDPTAVGRNKDMDLRRMAAVEQIVTTKIHVRRHFETRQQAVRCHASQSPGNNLRAFDWLSKWLFRYDAFARVEPPFGREPLERDLFAGIETPDA